MNMIKKNGGFTLVELIVVIAILAILAGIAVPAYTGYIKKAQQAADMQVLSSVNTAVQGLAVAEGVSVTSINVTAAGVVTVVDSDTDTDGVEITSDEVTALTGSLADAFHDDFVDADWAKVDGAGKWTANYN